MLIYIALFGGAAFGVLIAYLIIVERELKQKNRRLAELESRSGNVVEATDHEEEEQPRLPGLDTKPALADLREENSRLLAQVAELREERDAKQEKIRSLGSSQERLPEIERQLAEINKDKTRLVEQVAELTKERDASRGRVQELEGSQEKLLDLERQLTDLTEENSRLSSQIADLRSMILEKIESQLAGLNGLYQEVEASAKLFGSHSSGTPDDRTRT